MKVRGKVSRDRQLRGSMLMLWASSLLRILSSSPPSTSDTLVPIKAKICWITSHLRCPSPPPPCINLITRTEQAIHHTLGVAGFHPSVPLPRATSKRGTTTQSQALRFVPSCRNPIKVINCCVARCWGSTIVPCDRYELLCVGVCVCGGGGVVRGEVLWWIYHEIKCRFAELQDLTPDKRK